VNKELSAQLTPQRIQSIVSLVPDEWLVNGLPGQSPEDMRQVYIQFLLTRIETSQTFVKEALHARNALI
jgi:hypothetical protein